MFIQTTRYILFANILPLVRSRVDRVLYFDALDTIFQGDPFVSITNPLKLYVSSEDHCVFDNPWMTSWLDDLPGFSSDFVMDQNVICSGIFGGYTDVIEKFSQLHTSMYHNWKFYTEDQGIFNYILYTHILQRNGISIDMNPDFASIGMLVDVLTGKYPSEYEYNGYIPAIIHQLNRKACKRIENNYLTYCQMILIQIGCH